MMRAYEQFGIQELPHAVSASATADTAVIRIAGRIRVEIAEDDLLGLLNMIRQAKQLRVAPERTPVLIPVLGSLRDS